MRRLGSIALASLAALVLGLGSAWLGIRGGLSGGEVSNGPWRTSLVTGSTRADLYTRARVAVGGLLALAPSETIYFDTTVDSEGASLDARCDYRVEGRELPARWWSLTVYGTDHYLVPNDAGRYSFSQTTLEHGSGGPWTVRVSTRRKPGSWLPSGRAGDGGGFALTLRLYNPAPSVSARPGAAALPRITREACP